MKIEELNYKMVLKFVKVITPIYLGGVGFTGGFLAITNLFNTCSASCRVFLHEWKDKDKTEHMSQIVLPFATFTTFALVGTIKTVAYSTFFPITLMSAYRWRIKGHRWGNPFLTSERIYDISTLVHRPILERYTCPLPPTDLAYLLK